MVTSSVVVMYVHFHLQSAVFNLRRFIHTLPTMNIVENANMTADTATIAGARVAWPPSLGTTPGGGTAAGILQRSVPGGNWWEAISVSLMCVLICQLFQFSAEGLLDLLQRFKRADCMQHDAHQDMAVSTSVYKEVTKVRGITNWQHKVGLSQ